MKSTDRVLCALSLAAVGVAAALFVPPIRDKVFTTKLWPWPLPWDTTQEELQRLQLLCKPGDVIIESNLHGWQWIALSLATTGSRWVHAALVDENTNLLTVHKEVIQATFAIYLEWGSTSLALLRPPYRDKDHALSAIRYARSHVGQPYDASFASHAGNCNGLVATSLAHVGIPVSTRRCLGKDIYPANCFFAIEGAELIWMRS